MAGLHTSASPGVCTEEVEGWICSATEKIKITCCYAIKKNNHCKNEVYL